MCRDSLRRAPSSTLPAPTRRKAEDLQQVIATLDALGSEPCHDRPATHDVRRQPGRQAGGGRIRVCHVPKTTTTTAAPGEFPRSGFEPPGNSVSSWCKTLMRIRAPPAAGISLVVMGRSAATWPRHRQGRRHHPHDHPEEFRGRLFGDGVRYPGRRDTKTKGALEPSSTAVAIIAEGLLERVPAKELVCHRGVRITHEVMSCACRS